MRTRTTAAIFSMNAGGPEVPICHLTPGTANTPNIAGFVVDPAGHMNPIDSTQPIDPGPATGPAGGVSCTAAGAAGFSKLFTGDLMLAAADFQCGLNPPSFARSPVQIRFTPSGTQLVVTVKGTNAIYVFPVDKDGRAGDQPTVTQAPGSALPTFFGVTFDRNAHLLVTEAFGSSATIPAGAQGALSSLTITTDGNLQPSSRMSAIAGPRPAGSRSNR